MEDKDDIRNGMLKTGMVEHAFTEPWGYPTKVYTTASEQFTEAGWGTGGGYFEQGKAALDVWEYGDFQEVILVFSGNRLLSWNTKLSVKELARFGRALDKRKSSRSVRID
jgi:hypothetical protein